VTARRPSATALSALEKTHPPCVTTRSVPGPWAADLPLGGGVSMSYELRTSGGRRSRQASTGTGCRCYCTVESRDAAPSAPPASWTSPQLINYAPS
jgi:hypothetical protein